MSDHPLARLAGEFERLIALPADARAAALAATVLSTEDRAYLARLLAADADADDTLARVVGAGAARVLESPVRQLGAWHLVEPLGEGGMGAVYLARRTAGGFTQQAAVKLLRGFPGADALRRFRRERQILAGLDHPHIAHLLDGGETDDGQPWLALEYVDGQTLLAWAAEHDLDRAGRLALFDQMLDAVAYAHQHLIVHRDLKPANVMVNRDGQVKLLDFGIARLVELDGPADAASTRVFSPGYAAPEQLAGGAITTASDIYALGRLLDELVRARRVGGGEVTALAPVAVDADLAGIIAKATDPEPARRYIGANALREDLLRWREHRPVTAARITRAYRLRKFITRHRLGAVATLAAICALGVFVWRLDVARSRAVRAEAAAQAALAASERDAASARAALGFLTDAFKAAAPDVALSSQVSVRELLDAARRELATRKLDAAAVLQMQRLLGNLYADLGEKKIALELLGRGLADRGDEDAPEALRLALDFDRQAELLAMDGQQDAALKAAHAARALRQRFALGNVPEAVRSITSEAYVLHFNGQREAALDKLREARRLLDDLPAPPAQLRYDVLQLMTGLLAAGGECDAARDAAREALNLLGTQPENAPDRIQMLRDEASAERACGNPSRAAMILREAIAAQARVVGAGGTRMAALRNDLAVALNDLGRYREAAAWLEASGSEVTAAESPLDQATDFNNRAGLLENAGDYAAALTLHGRARALLDAQHLPADNVMRRQFARNEARTLALAGQAPRAVALLTDLAARSAQLDGTDAVDYALYRWQLALAERRAGRVDAARKDLASAMAVLRPKLPSTHAIFGHEHRLLAALAAASGQPRQAAREQETAVALLRKADAAKIDLAIAHSELAEFYRVLGHTSEARALLTAALPQLRSALLPGEVARAAAERTAARLGVAG